MTFTHRFRGLHLKVKNGDLIRLKDQCADLCITVGIEKLPSIHGSVAIITINAPKTFHITRKIKQDSDFAAISENQP